MNNLNSFIPFESALSVLEKGSNSKDITLSYITQCYNLIDSIITFIETRLSHISKRPYAEYKILKTKVIVILDKRDLSECKLEAEITNRDSLINILWELKASILED